jgi:hypothetical protein
MSRPSLFLTCFAGLALLASAGCGSSDAPDAEADAPANSDAPSPVAAQLTPMNPAPMSATAPPPASAPSSSAALEPEASGDAGSAEIAAAAPAAQFAACFTGGGPYSDCESIYVTMAQTAPARCVQLTFDKCEGGYGRRGLAADVPSAWRLSSGSVGASSSPCALGAFYPESALVDDASGTASWEEGSGPPSTIELALTLELRNAASVELTTAAPLELSTCED